MEWSEVALKDPIYLNLGGGNNCHPKPDYQQHLAIDLSPHENDWSVKHDLTTPIPLPDGSVTKIHSEDFLEHITEKDIERLFKECFRVLKPKGMLRIGVPDYNNPKDRFCLTIGHDPRDPKHRTLTTYNLMKPLVENSPFSRSTFYHYWDADCFIQNPIDYSLGMIKRTPDNDHRCRRRGLVQILSGAAKDAAFILYHGFRYAKQDFLAQEGHPLYVTSLVVDLFKE